MAWIGKEYTTWDPELERIMAKIGVPKPFLPTADSMPKFRKRWAAGTERFVKSPVAQKALKESGAPNWTEKDIQIPVRDGSLLDARVYSPNDTPKNGPPVMVVFHGGGWCMGGIDTEEFQCQLWCQRLGVLVINVAYRLCPEYIFPIPPLDCYDAVKWVATNAAVLGGDLSKGFVIVGVSGGGTFAAAATHLARDDNLQPPITGVFLSIPVFIKVIPDDTAKSFLLSSLYHSEEENQDAPLLSTPMNKRFGELSKADPSSPLTSVFQFQSHNDLPPVYIQACGLDPFRDGCFIYEGLLRTAGSKTKMDIYPGLPHSFWTAFPMLTATKKWVQDTLEGAAWLLREGRKSEITAHL